VKSAWHNEKARVGEKESHKGEQKRAREKDVREAEAGAAAVAVAADSRTPGCSRRRCTRQRRTIAAAPARMRTRNHTRPRSERGE
jgi:hypothetical protein